MSKFNKLSRTEMKNVMGGVAQVTCTIQVLGDNGFTESGPCASGDVNACFGYAESKCSTYNAQNGYPGCNFSCTDNLS